MNCLISHMSAAYGPIQENINPRRAVRQDLDNDRQLFDLVHTMKEKGGISEEDFQEACGQILENRLVNIAQLAVIPVGLVVLNLADELARHKRNSLSPRRELARW